MIKTLRSIFNLSLISLLLISCSAQQGMAKRKPQWANERPINPEYYVGIAVVKKDLTKTNYIQLAKNQALHDLCSEISVNISANSVLHQFENEKAFREEFKSEVHTSLMEELEGYELVGSWDNKRENEYWVYYRLSKSEYELQKRVKLNHAKKLAQNFYEQAKLSEKNLDLFQALNFYAKSLDAIKKHLDEDLSIMTFNGRINLGTDLYNSIQNIFKRTQLTPNNKEIQLEISTAHQEPILIKAEWLGESENQLIPNLPLSIDFVKGDGVLNNKVSTDEFGYASSILSKVNSKMKLQEIEVGLDLSSILDEEVENYKLNKLFFTPELAPKGKITINVDRLKAYLIFNEKIFGEDSNREILKNNMKKELSENFFSFTTDKSKAKVILNINTNVTKGEIKEGRNYKVYIVYLDCFFSLTNAKSGMEIFNDAIYELKGMKPISYDYAVKEAYEQAVEAIHNNIIPKLNQLDL